MAMTALTDIKAITPTANAKAVVSAKGSDIAGLMAHAQVKAAELQVLVKQIIALHPTSGADAANLTALNAILAELV
jgi:hypothetical protein